MELFWSVAADVILSLLLFWLLFIFGACLTSVFIVPSIIYIASVILLICLFKTIMGDYTYLNFIYLPYLIAFPFAMLIFCTFTVEVILFNILEKSSNLINLLKRNLEVKRQLRFQSQFIKLCNIVNIPKETSLLILEFMKDDEIIHFLK